MLCVPRLAEQPMQSHINVGSGSDVTIAESAHAEGQTVGYQRRIEFDTNKPDGVPRKRMDSRRLNALGWQPSIDLPTGLKTAYQDFVLLDRLYQFLWHRTAPYAFTEQVECNAARHIQSKYTQSVEASF